MDDEREDFGPCCACGQPGAAVRNIIMLERQAPQAGTGWGCVQCGAPNDGALAVVCDHCAAHDVPLQFACAGPLREHGRVPFADLMGTHAHDLAKHPELDRTCRECGCSELHACVDDDGVPCWWVQEDLCSACAIGDLAMQLEMLPYRCATCEAVFSLGDAKEPESELVVLMGNGQGVRCPRCQQGVGYPTRDLDEFLDTMLAPRFAGEG